MDSETLKKIETLYESKGVKYEDVFKILEKIFDEYSVSGVFEDELYDFMNTSFNKDELINWINNKIKYYQEYNAFQNETDDILKKRVQLALSKYTEFEVCQMFYSLGIKNEEEFVEYYKE
jgi:hypothetical protein